MRRLALAPFLLIFASIAVAMYAISYFKEPTK